MNTILAQAAALAAHAKRARSHPSSAWDAEYWRRHSTMRYVRAVSFVAPAGSTPSELETVATEPAAWLASLGSVAAEDVSLVSLGSAGRIPLPEHLAAAFAGGTPYGIAVGPRGLWVGAWEVTHRSDPAKRIWSVTYARTDADLARARDPSVEDALRELALALQESAAVARSDPALEQWVGTFEEAARSLERPDAAPAYNPDILPVPGYGVGAHQLLAGAARAWVFGGMGSWNDVSFEDPGVRARYESATRRLYAAVTGGVLSAVNRGLE